MFAIRVPVIDGENYRDIIKKLEEQAKINLKEIIGGEIECKIEMETDKIVINNIYNNVKL